MKISVFSAFYGLLIAPPPIPPKLPQNPPPKTPKNQRTMLILPPVTAFLIYLSLILLPFLLALGSLAIHQVIPIHQAFLMLKPVAQGAYKALKGLLEGP